MQDGWMNKWWMINNADNYFVHFDHQWQTFFFFFFFFLYQHIYHPSTQSININIIGSNLECGPLSKLITIELQYYWQQKIIIPSCNRKITSSIIVSPPIPPPTTTYAFSNCTIIFYHPYNDRQTITNCNMFKTTPHHQLLSHHLLPSHLSITLITPEIAQYSASLDTQTQRFLSTASNKRNLWHHFTNSIVLSGTAPPEINCTTISRINI